MRMIRKHAVWVVLATLVGLIGAWLATSGKSVAYTSSADVDVEARIISGTPPVTPNLSTEKSVATSGVVLDSAAPLLGMTPSQLAGDLTVSVSGTSNILSIGCTLPQPAQAQNCATVATQAYINFRNDASQKKAAQSRDPLDVTLVTPANLPVKPAGTKRSVLLSIGAFLGFLLGLGAAYVRDRADDRVRDRDDLSQVLGAPALVAIPRVRRRGASPAFVFASDPDSAAAEAYRYLRVRIEALAPADAAKGNIVLVTGPRGGEGATSVASNLATALAQSGARVILVDADVRNASLSAAYGVTERPGLTDLLTGMAALSDVVIPTEAPKLMMVAAGTMADRLTDVFEVTSLSRVFGPMTAAADVVVVDSAPVLSASDPIALASISHVVVITADVRRTTRTAARAAAAEISASGRQHLVGVLTSVPHALRARLPFLSRSNPRTRPAPATPGLRASGASRSPGAHSPGSHAPGGSHSPGGSRPPGGMFTPGAPRTPGGPNGPGSPNGPGAQNGPRIPRAPGAPRDSTTTRAGSI
jgi:polysaccharide biosynthesis transport protein